MNRDKAGPPCLPVAVPIERGHPQVEHQHSRPGRQVEQLPDEHLQPAPVAQHLGQAKLPAMTLSCFGRRAAKHMQAQPFASY